MKHCIRKNCFETNSSSVHSIIITKEPKSILKNDKVAQHMYPVCNLDIDILEVNDNDFGWGFNILSTMYEKAVYCIASLCCDINNIVHKPCTSYEDIVGRYEECLEVVHEVEDIIKEANPDFDHIELPRKQYAYFYDDKEINPYAVNPYTGGSYAVLNGEQVACLKIQTSHSEYLYFGDIDHQSYGLINRDDLREIILDDNKHIIIDNDNSRNYYELCESGDIDTTNIVGEW